MSLATDYAPCNYSSFASCRRDRLFRPTCCLKIFAIFVLVLLEPLQLLQTLTLATNSLLYFQLKSLMFARLVWGVIMYYKKTDILIQHFSDLDLHGYSAIARAISPSQWTAPTLLVPLSQLGKVSFQNTLQFINLSPKTVPGITRGGV